VQERLALGRVWHPLSVYSFPPPRALGAPCVLIHGLLAPVVAVAACQCLLAQAALLHRRSRWNLGKGSAKDDLLEPVIVDKLGNQRGSSSCPDHQSTVQASELEGPRRQLVDQRPPSDRPSRRSARRQNQSSGQSTPCKGNSSRASWGMERRATRALPRCSCSTDALTPPRKAC